MNLLYKYQAPTCIYHMIWEDLMQIWYLDQKNPGYKLYWDDSNLGRWGRNSETLFPLMPDWIDWMSMVKDKKEIIKLSEVKNPPENFDLEFEKHHQDVRNKIDHVAFSNTILKSLGIQRNLNPEKYIFINRDCGRREVINAKDLVRKLNDRGYPFEYYEFEKTKFKWQAKLFNNARWVIAPEGAALTHMMFMEPGAKVTAIHPHCYTEKCEKGGFPAQFSKFYNLNYEFKRAEPFTENCISKNHEQCFNKLWLGNKDLNSDIKDKLYGLKGLSFDGCYVTGMSADLNANQWLKNAVKNQNMTVDLSTIIQF